MLDQVGDRREEMPHHRDGIKGRVRSETYLVTSHIPVPWAEITCSWAPIMGPPVADTSGQKALIGSLPESALPDTMIVEDTDGWPWVGWDGKLKLRDLSSEALSPRSKTLSVPFPSVKLRLTPLKDYMHKRWPGIGKVCENKSAREVMKRQKCKTWASRDFA